MIRNTLSTAIPGMPLCARTIGVVRWSAADHMVLGPLLQTVDEAFESGTLRTAHNNGVFCQCATQTIYRAGWGRRANEWPAHQKGGRHQLWAWTQPKMRKLSDLGVAGSSSAADRKPAAERGDGPEAGGFWKPASL